MSRMPLPDPIYEFLQRPNPAVMGTVARDGRPVTVATWYLMEDETTMLLGLDAGRARLAHMKREPRVSLTALSEGNWGTHVSVQGRVVSLAEDEGLHRIDRLAQHYIGIPYPDRTRARVFALVELDRWHSWGELGKVPEVDRTTTAE